MTAAQTTAAPVARDRKPRDEEIDVYGLTHPGKLRTENQDHFLIRRAQEADGSPPDQPGRDR